MPDALQRTDMAIRNKEHTPIHEPQLREFLRPRTTQLVSEGGLSLADWHFCVRPQLTNPRRSNVVESVQIVPRDKISHKNIVCDS
jgi:hypothetical protein